MLAFFSFAGTFSTVGMAIAVAGAIGLILAYARANLAKSTIELQSEQIIAQSQRIETLEDDLKRAKETIISNSKQIRALKESLDVLERVKTGTDAMNQLTNEIKNMGLNIIAKLDLLNRG